MSINYKDIATISSALRCGDTMLQIKIEELEEKGLGDIANSYKLRRENTKEAIKSLQKIRKQLHLSDDIAYNEKFRK